MYINQWEIVLQKVFDEFSNAVILHSGYQFYQIECDFSELSHSEESLSNLNWSKSNFEMDSQAHKNLALIKEKVVAQNTSVDVLDLVNDEHFDNTKMTVGNKHISQLICFPLTSNDQRVVGTVCVFDDKSVSLSAEQVLIIKLLVRNLCLDIEVLRKDVELNSIRSFLSGQLNDQLDEFIQIASHDLYSPLNAIESLITWIEEDVNEGIIEDNPKHFEMARNSIKRMQNLLKSLGDYSRIKRSEIKPETLGLKALVAESCDDLDVPDNFELCIDDCQLESWKQPLIFIFKCLIDNAIKHHDKTTGVINISCVSNKDNYTLSITDDGPGIASKFHDRIFKPFQTLKSKDEVESSGLGLASVKKIVELHGGNITIDSTVGAGAIFVVEWPKFASIDNNPFSSIDVLK